MKTRTAILLLTLAASLPAAAQLETVVRAVEASASNLNVPTSANGRLIFRPCQGPCEAEYIAVRLAPETAYTVNGEPTDFSSFRSALLEVARSTDAYALVSYEPRTNKATSIRIATERK